MKHINKLYIGVGIILAILIGGVAYMSPDTFKPAPVAPGDKIIVDQVRSIYTFEDGSVSGLTTLRMKGGFQPSMVELRFDGVDSAGTVLASETKSVPYPFENANYYPLSTPEIKAPNGTIVDIKVVVVSIQ